MPLKREEVIDKLEMVAPALADHDLIPILTRVLFTGTHLVAFNDRIGIATPLKTDFKGTAPGKMLIDTLRIVTHASQVEIKSVNSSVQIVAGKTKLVLDSQPESDYAAIFKMPPRPKDVSPIPEEFFSAIEDCLQSAADHSTKPEHLGITIIPTKSGIKLFGTNDKTISYSKISLPPQAGVKQRTILPAAFCREMLRIAKISEKSTFVLRNDHALFASEKATLFGRLVQTDNPINFEATMQRHWPAKGKIPVKLSEKQRPRLKSALELAARICDIKGNEVRTHVQCNKGTMEFTSNSARGDAFDRIELKHDPIDVYLEASCLRDVYDRYEDILFTNQCVVLSKDNMNSVFLLATYQKGS